jgi:hypothetical protein
MNDPLSLKFLTILLSVTFMGLLSFHAKAEEGRWKFIGESKTETRWYIDAETISYPSENVVSVWVKSVPDKTRADEQEGSEKTEEILKRIQERYFGGYDYTEALWEIHCSKAMFRLLYFRACGDGNKTLFSTLTPDSEWTYVMPGSVGETVRDAVCGLRE